MDLIDVIGNIQNKQYSFMEDYYIKPTNEDEHNKFIDFCLDKGISYVSGKSPKGIPFYDDSRKQIFSFIANKNGINLVSDSYQFSVRKNINVTDFLLLYQLKVVD